MHGLHSTSAHLWAPEKAGLRQPHLILSPCLETPENAVVQFPRGGGGPSLGDRPPRGGGGPSSLGGEGQVGGGYTVRLWRQVLRKYLRGTQGRVDLCFGGFGTYQDPNRLLSSIQPSGAIEETGPIVVNLFTPPPMGGF